MRLTPTIAFVSLLVAAAPALAEPRLSVARSRAGAVRGNETLVVRWQGLPAEVEEVELLLSVDGGRHYALRLTESVSPDSGSYEWVVPNVATPQARLAIRAGIEGREEILVTSDRFAIESADSAPAGVSLRVHRGELWAVAADRVAPSDDGTFPAGLEAPPILSGPQDFGHDALPPGGPAGRLNRFPRGWIAAARSNSNSVSTSSSVAFGRTALPLRI